MVDGIFERIRPIPEVSSVSRDYFQNSVVSAHQPVVLRGLVDDWELVSRARESDKSLIRYLQKKTIPGPVKTVEAPRDSGGRYFYTSDLSGFNFRRVKTTFYEFSERLLRQKGDPDAPVVSLQSAYTDDYFTDVHLENLMSLMDDSVRPRIWVGGKTIVATHHDDAENIACVAAGRRRFVLFPPEQISNLYIGPIDKTPSGAPVSMVSLNEPDFDRFPRFRQALEHAQVAVLNPGDAIYIPALWWHHVEALDEINVLVNYWQGGAIGGARGAMPLDAMLLSMATLRDRSEPVRQAWKALFDFYLFGNDSEVAGHIPETARGFLDKSGEERLNQIRPWLLKQLSEE
ncbi:cupin-like domain-containing protein [uncultured Microbulbifer sp.]|uniref:cupin-like domain-containing protein n=1 Tax=uncultured Microbulbifer sp. TaxID=348147 RepID=UPI0025FC4610|nr:cupin-like domain-containing protein [uncultured Microbulbifer sp.]